MSPSGSGAHAPHVPLRDLGVIGDRRTAAIVTRAGAIVWYCPGRFDRPSIFGALLDERAGSWRVEGPDLSPRDRAYIGASGVLRTNVASSGGRVEITDFMPMGPGLPEGICRILGPSPGPLRMTLEPAPDYARHAPAFLRVGERAVEIGAGEVHTEKAGATGIDLEEDRGAQRLLASHPLEIHDRVVQMDVPPGEKAWAALLRPSAAHDAPQARPRDSAERGAQPRIHGDDIDRWLDATLTAWRDLDRRITYRGPYREQVASSFRAIRLLTHGERGGIIAAPTTSLPEVPGGGRNYDYRFVWVRDAGMIVSALTRAESEGTDGRAYLSFVCGSRRNADGLPVAPFYTLDGEIASGEVHLDLAGYRGSRPVRIGNGANRQLQLDALGNVLLAAKLIYGRFGTREHWPVVEAIADYLTEHWQDPDHGIWEEHEMRQYTSGKVIVACGLDSIAEYSDEPEQADRWRRAVGDIRTWVARHCMTRSGAFAAVAGGDDVDVSAALFPVWNYVAPDAPEMLATMEQLERRSRTGRLYRRHLEEFDARREGAFLAGTFWVAQYWIMRGDLERARAILDHGVQCANDLGLFSEEVDPETSDMLGNLPQSFTHAAFVGAALDLDTALRQG